jgi:hypothetical protein
MHYFSNLFWYRTFTCFGQVYCPSSGVWYCIHSNRYLSYRVAGSGWNWSSHVILVIKTNEMHCFSNLFWYRTLRVSDRFSVHQESSTVYTAIGICHTGYVDCLLARSGWNSSSIPIPLARVSKTCMTNTYCCVYSTRLLMMDSEPVRNT